MSVPTENANYAGGALSYFTGAFGKLPNIAGHAKAIMVGVQELEGVFWQIMNLQVATDTGQQLNEDGELVGQPRNMMADAHYRTAITLRIAVNRSNGRVTNWSNFGKILLGTWADAIAYSEAQAALSFGAWNLTLEPNVVASVLADAVPNGVRGVFEYSTWEDGNDFEWGDVNNLSTTGQGGFGDSVAGAVGGLLVSGVEMT